MNKYEHLRLSILPMTFKYILLENSEDLVKCLSNNEARPIALFQSEEESSAIIPDNVNVPCQKEELGWSCITIVGEMPFGTVQGLIATITNALFEEGLGVCVVSTYLSDWFFVRTKNLEAVKDCLEKNNWSFL
tara:strand:+ start:6219 stop:6617 length:399 start_codon:yes stop_codon:yes gene_type:complete